MARHNSIALLVSLGKTAAQITADFAPVPGLCPAAELLCGIIQLCENVVSNRHEARQLKDRCHTLLLAAKESHQDTPNGMTEAFQSIQNCVLRVKKEMEIWVSMGRIDAFLRQHEIKAEIGRCHEEISNCLTKFQLISHLEINHWQEEFAANAKRDHQELIEYLSEIQNSQSLVQDTLNKQTLMMETMMMMQKAEFQFFLPLLNALSENKYTADRMHNGLSSNLYQLQLQSNEILPNLHLNSGEVTRIGQFPVSGTAAMDIYEGLYLQREKVAIKVVRAVNSNEHSMRRFMREVKVWAEIWRVDRGKHILPFYGFCQNDGPFPYMVSPWQQNGNALAYVKKHDSSVNYRKMIKHIALGLKVLHDMSVVHGDIKAGNIVINSYGDPLLADFGLSQIVEDITGIPFTQSRGVSDSYRWFAPEVCVGQGVLSASSDIYALGMTILELFTHQQPYGNIKHTTEVVIRSSRGEFPTRPMEERVIQRGLDDQLWRLLNVCWNPAPSERPSINVVLDQLSQD